MHGIDRMVHLPGQLFDLYHGLTDHLVAQLRLLVGGGRRLRGEFGVLRHFVNRCAHLVHGCGDLIGFVFLLGDPDLGLLADRSQLFDCRGQLGDAPADPANQFAQAQGHGLHAVLQLTHLVAALHGPGQLQIALGNTSGQGQGLFQRDGDLQGDQPGCQAAEQQSQHGFAGQYALGLDGFGVALLDLTVAQFAAGIAKLNA
ncbi:hypothetical protein D3C81_661610 [compost metagenome]